MRDWQRLLPALELAYNTTSPSSTELSLFESMLGEKSLHRRESRYCGCSVPSVGDKVWLNSKHLDVVPCHGLQCLFVQSRRRVCQQSLRLRAGGRACWVISWAPERKLRGERVDIVEMMEHLPSRTTKDATSTALNGKERRVWK